MPKKYLTSIGSDMKKPGKFYWDVKDASRKKIVLRRGFKSKSDAAKDMQAFKKALDEPVANFAGSDRD